MKVEIKQLSLDSVIPSYAKESDAGLDLTAISKTVLNEKDYGYVEYGTGLAMAIPEGHVGLLFPRSSISNTGLFLANAVGVVDSGYRGEVKLRFKYIPNTKIYEIGERVAQLIIVPYPKVEFELKQNLDTTSRGEGGFGSTGKWVNNEQVAP